MNGRQIMKMKIVLHIALPSPILLFDGSLLHTIRLYEGDFEYELTKTCSIFKIKGLLSTLILLFRYY